MANLPTQSGVEDLMLTAIVSLLTSALQSAIDTGDVSRALVVKAGPRQAAPEAVSVMIHENDPDDPSGWAHKPMGFRRSRASEGPRTAYNYSLVGGGSAVYSRAFTIEVEVFGLYFSGLDSVEREDVRKVASTVARRMVRALQDAGPEIGTGNTIQDDFGEIVLQGPFVGDAWTDPEEGESLLVRKFVRVWYQTGNSWNA